MDKKSFLRGFGVGVLFVTVILGISFLIRTSDSAIISSAKKLGMTFAESDNKTVYNTAGNASGSAVLNNNSANDKQAASSTPVPSANVSKKKNKNKEFDTEKNKMEKGMEDEKKKLTINSGDWAKKVADRLQNEGIIDDSDKFVDYMKENDYAGKIRAGEYEFEKDEDFSEIAQMITKQKKGK